MVLPLFQKADEFNLELMSFDVAPNYTLYTNQGIPVTVEAITQLKVENEDEKIKRAANQFLSKTEDDRETMVRQVMEGHLRGIVGQLTVEQLVKDPELVSARMRETVAADLDKLGLEVVSFTLKDVNDDSGYIQNMSRPEIARNKQMAEIAEAEAARNVAMREAETQRESAQAPRQGRPGPCAGADALRAGAGRGAARPAGEAGRVRRDRLGPEGAGRQSLRHPVEHHAAAAGRGTDQGRSSSRSSRRSRSSRPRPSAAPPSCWPRCSARPRPSASASASWPRPSSNAP